MSKPQRILISSGEPAGIGPEIIATIAQEPWPFELVVIGDPDLLLSRAKHLNLPLHLLPFDKNAPPASQPASHLKIIPLALARDCKAGQLNKENAPYVMALLEKAAHAALQQEVDAIVTAPVHKAVLNEAGFTFQGHTEFFANAAGVSEDTVMLFVWEGARGKEARVALLTTHLPLAQVPSMLTAEKLEKTVRTVQQALINQFKITDPIIAICGLNPHAGESGYIGREEIEIMIPTLHRLRQEGLPLQGPLSADTIFMDKHLEKVDAIVAMYHDQALPVVKTLSFGKAVNVTLGLPFVRTSVDHGTALEIAGTGKADAGSLREAIKIAARLAMSN